MTAPRRHTDWRARLSIEIERHRREPYSAGQHDCALFAADCILAMTGWDPAAEFRGKYDSIESGEAAIRAAGYATLEEMAAVLLDEVPPARTRLGDIVSVVAGDDTGLGVVLGERVAVLRPDGVGTIGREMATRGFRV